MLTYLVIQFQCLLLSYMMFKFRATAVADSGGLEVAIFWNGYEMATALLAKATSTITTMFDAVRRKGTTEFCFTLIAIEGEMGWYPDRGSARLVCGSRD